MDRRFWSITLVVACVLIAIVDHEMFLGKVPFPSFSFFEWAPFLKAAPPEPLQVPANIGDVVTSFYPFRAIAAQTARDGEFPLWNPYMLSGTPLLASAQSAVFSPLTLPYYLLPTPVAWGLVAILKLLIVILSAAAFVRQIGGTITGSIAAAVLFGFCGFLTVWQAQAMYDAAIWLPLICLAVVRLHEKPSTGSVILGAIAFAMPVLAGHPETVAHTTLTALALAAFLFATQPRAMFVLCFAASGMLSMGLASVQLLPSLEWVRYAYRSLSDPWPPQPLWSAVGWVSRDVLHSTSSAGIEIPEQASYVGMLAFAAAPLALLNRSRKMVWFFLAWTAIVLSVAYGIGPMYWLSLHLPIIQGVKNSRLIFVGCFGVSVLAGLGVSEVERWSVAEHRKQRMRAAAYMLAGCSIALLLIYALRIATFEVSEPSRYPRVSAIFLMLAASALLLRLAGKLSAMPFRIAILIIVFADAVGFSYGFMPFSDVAHIYPHIELFDRLPGQGVEPFRIAQVSGAYLENVHSMYGLSAVGGYEICLRRIKEFLMDVSEKEMSSVRFLAENVLAMKDRRLDMLNAKYFIVPESEPRALEFQQQTDRFRLLYSSGKTQVYENLKALPAAFLVPASGVALMTDDAALERIKDPAFDPRRVVFLSAPPSGPVDMTNPLVRPNVEWVLRKANSFEMNVTAETRSVLLVSQTYYPGWAAYVDGQRVDVFPADYVLTGIEIPPGDHHVRFVFQSPSFRIGLFISAVTVVVLIGLAIDSRRSRFKPSDSRRA